MSFAFFLGEYFVGMMLIGGLEVAVLLVVAAFWTKFPPRSPIIPALIYLILAAICFAIWSVARLSLVMNILVLSLVLPWSLIFFLEIPYEFDISEWWLLLGVVLNGLIIYGLAVLARKKPNANHNAE
jgi:hypothetical protein